MKISDRKSSTLILNTAIPKSCCLSPLLYSLFTHDCVDKNESNNIIKFVDNTTIFGLITNDDKAAYRKELKDLTLWCQQHVYKTKEIIID